MDAIASALTPAERHRRHRLEQHYARTPFVREICIVGTAPTPGPSTVTLDNGAGSSLHAIAVADAALLRRRRITGVSEWVRFELETLAEALPRDERPATCRVVLEPLPRTPEGDVDRVAAERLAASPLPGGADAAPDDDEIVRRVVEIASRASGRRAWPSAHLDLDLGLDSIARLELALEVERALGRRVDDGLVSSACRVAELAALAREGEPVAAGPGGDPWQLLLGPESLAGAAPVEQPAHGRHWAKAASFLLLKLLYAVARPGLGLRVSGLEHLPRRGPFLICPNHETMVDGLYLAAGLPWRVWSRAFFVGATEYFATPASAWFARALGVVPIDADGNLAGAMRAAAGGLRAGQVLVLFPEGERTIDGRLKRFRAGAPILASRVGVPIVPLAISGAYGRWPRGHAFQWARFLRREPPVRVRFGAPFTPGQGGVPTDAEAVGRLLRDRVAALLADSLR